MRPESCSTGRSVVGLLALCLLALGLLVPGPAAAQETAPQIASPQSNSEVNGLVPIIGTSAVEGFLSAELAFAYADNPTGSWFQLAVFTEPLTEATLAVWDTTTVSDGFYSLRLRAYLADGTFLDALVTALLVRNYTPTETPIPTQTLTPTLIVLVDTETPVPTETRPPIPFPTPTPLPTNPAVVAPATVFTSLGYGAAVILGAFLLFGIYLWIRRKG
ncbi:MAG: hypothetical protein JXB85_04340 [Anaerolineales bacterium]|nr:hypothetical protein [Anaerolineales bacterium]